MTAGTAVYPVILSGGSGTRLWPLSRSHYPKQLTRLIGNMSLLQQTAERASVPGLFHAPVVIANQEHRFFVAQALSELEIAPEAIILEPEGRNTAPAAVVAAAYLAERDPNAIVALLPSDHHIRNVPAFHDAMARAAATAATGRLVAFAISPDRPETGYGYIRQGAALSGTDGAYAVDAFVEKPDAETAAGFLATGGYAWNSGMFVFSARTMLEEARRHAPDIATASEQALAGAVRDLDFLRLDAQAFAACRSESIDYAIMEKTDRAAVLPADIGWNDVGSWHALWAEGPVDENGNVVLGNAVLEDVQGSYIRGSSDQLVAALGLKDMVVVATDDAVLVAPRDRSGEVKNVVAHLKQAGRIEADQHRTVSRPWGSFKEIDSGPRFKVRRLTILPGGKLAVQRHRHRAEHWVVVTGTATITRGDRTMTLGENESLFAPPGQTHRVENRGEDVLHLVEVQSGSYLAEDDVERFSDGSEGPTSKE